MIFGSEIDDRNAAFGSAGTGSTCVVVRKTSQKRFDALVERSSNMDGGAMVARPRTRPGPIARERGPASVGPRSAAAERDEATGRRGGAGGRDVTMFGMMSDEK